MAEHTTVWFFNVKGVNDKERNPGWAEFFSFNRSTVGSVVADVGLVDKVIGGAM